MSEMFIGFTIFLTAFAISFRLAPYFARRASGSGHVDVPGGRKEQAMAIPYGGGTAILAALGATIVLGLAAAVMAAPHFDFIGLHLRGLWRRGPRVLFILFGALLMWDMGRRDDRSPIPAKFRLMFQFMIMFPLAASSLRLTLFIENEVLQVALTLLWLVFTTNAWNFIDNMDGLLPGTALIAAAGFAGVALVSGQLFVAAFALALAGSLAGVLPHNRRPARIYLGDEGSMLVGFLLGSLAMVASYRYEQHTSSYLPFLIPNLILLVPIVDAVVAITGRLLRGISPFTAGRDHLSHRLVARGFSARATVRILQGCAALGACAALAFYADSRLGLALTILFLLLALFRFYLGFGKPQCH